MARRTDSLRVTALRLYFGDGLPALHAKPLVPARMEIEPKNPPFADEPARELEASALPPSLRDVDGPISKNVAGPLFDGPLVCDQAAPRGGCGVCPRASAPLASE